VNVVISGANLALLSLGRFVFLPYQRAQARRAPCSCSLLHVLLLPCA